MTSTPLLPLLLKGAPFTFLAIFFLYPLVTILGQSLGQGEGPLLAPFVELLRDPYYLGRVWFTFWQAGFSTISFDTGIPRDTQFTLTLGCCVSCI